MNLVTSTITLELVGKLFKEMGLDLGSGSINTDIDYDDNRPLSEKSTAMKCEIEGRKGEYSSIENFRDRTKVNSTIVEAMKTLGLLDGLKESDQNTVFDYI